MPQRLTRLALIALFTVSLSVSLSAGEPRRKKPKPPQADEPDPSLLTVPRIFASGDFSSQGFSASWTDDGSAHIRLEASQDPFGGKDIVRRDARTDEVEILVPAAHLIPAGASSPLEVESFRFSEDRSLLLIYTNSKRVWRRNTRGDYWLLDRSSRELRKLGGDARPSSLMFAKISPTGAHVAYVRENNIYIEDLLSHEILPLTTQESDTIINGTFDWVYEEEFGLRDGFRWSADGHSIAYWQLDVEGVRQFTMINNTDALYPRTIPFAYPKVGQQNAVCRAGVVDIWSGETRWIDTPGDPRQHYIARMDWIGDSNELTLQYLNRRQNTNTLLLADAATGSVRELFVDRDEAWVDVCDEIRWLDDHRRFTWISYRDGWRSVYLVSRESGQVSRVTLGEYDVIRLLEVDEKRGWLYFLASPDNPTQQYLWRVRLDGSDAQRVTPQDQSGTHAYQISPDGGLAVHTVSSFGTPGTTDLIELSSHQTLRPLEENEKLRQAVEKLKQSPGEFFRVDIGDGLLLDGWCIKPPNFNARKKYPLLVYVYGEPAGYTVRDSWGGSGYLWHLMLAQRGYIVVSIDNRGTPAPRGREWRKCVYGKVGVIAPREQAAAIKKLCEQRPYIDADRIGVWGWSGGGSMSLNAIFKFPELYSMAMAVAPVPNQRYYDTIYQERYMGLPGDNVDGFLQGSPINYAHQLRGNLLLVHGTGDDNCHYQTTEALINELIRYNKPFSMMAYPNRTHSIREGSNTTVHLRELLTRYLTENLPAGARDRK